MYSKAGFWCVELPDRDGAGRPIIMSYPIGDIFSVARPHPDHIGCEPRQTPNMWPSKKAKKKGKK